MQTADCRPCRQCRPCRLCRLSTFFLTLASLFSVQQFQNSVQYVPVTPKRRPCRLQTADCRPCRPCRPCRLSTFFLILGFAFTFDSHIFSLWSQISVHRYISECLFMKRPFYVTRFSWGDPICPDVCYLSTGRTAQSETSDCWFNKRNVFSKLCMENSLYCSSINILNSSIKIKFHTFWAYIASIVDGFVVLLRLSNLLLLFLISL